MDQAPLIQRREHIVLQDGGELLLIDPWLAAPGAQQTFDHLRASTPWRHESIVIAGHTVAQPRLTAWYGDPDATYVYSGLKNVPLPWTAALADLRQRIQREAGVPFNSVLLNYYRDGNDAMGMHADAERELGINPVIASLSLGASRRFVIQHRRDKTDRRSIMLSNGSLLLMLGTTQHHYKHGVPRRVRSEARINLTFRKVR